MADAKTRLANRERQRRFREAHRDEINEQRKERYNNRIAKGKCPRCGVKVKKGHTLCENCCEYQANLNRKYAKQRKKITGKVPAAKAKTAAKKSVKVASKKPAAKANAAVKKPVKKDAAKKPAAKAKPAAASKKPAAKAKK